MKTIMVIAPAGVETRNILRTDVFRVLKSNNLRIIILTPISKEDYFIKELADRHIIFEKLHKPGKLSFMYHWLHFAWFMNPDFSETIRIKTKALKQRRPLFSLPARIIGVLCKFQSGKRLIEKIGLLLLNNKSYDRIIREYKPLLVFATYRFNPFDPYVFAVLRTFAHHKVPSVCFIPSWDNLSSKGKPPLEMGKLIVWNEINKEEAIRLHNYSAKDVYVSGAPQFDIYFRKEGICSREEFFREIGADLDRKLLVYTTTSSATSDIDPEIIEIIKSYIDDNRFFPSCQLLIRIHPLAYYERKLYEPFKGYKNVIVEASDRYNTHGIFWDPSTRDMIHLANLIHHADVVINVASTTTIEACIFDTPVVNIGFDGNQQEPYWASTSRFYEYTHYKRVVEAEGVRVAKNKEELLKYINDYLENPELDREGREKIVEEQCYYTDGKSGERVAKYVLDFLDYVDEGGR